MPVRFEAGRSQLLVIDVQTRLLPALGDGKALVTAAVQLVKACRYLEVPVTILEENPAGLGSTAEEVTAAAGDIQPLSKMAFGAADEPDLLAHAEKARAGGRDQMVLLGAEAHVCVLQTALGLCERGFTVGVVADALASRRASDREIALQRLAASGAILLSREMILFEWLRTAAHPAFKDLLQMVR